MGAFSLLFGSEVQHLARDLDKLAHSPLPFLGSSDVLPGRFCENTSCFDSVVGTVEPLCLTLWKALSPLPHYLLFIWYLLERWHHAACGWVCRWSSCSLQTVESGR